MCIEKIRIRNKRNKDIFVNIYNKDRDSDIMIVCHGFDSSKNGSVVKHLVDNVDLIIVSFDFPSHGESNEELLLSNCIDDLMEVDNYVRKHFHKNVSLFGSSFGAYVILNFLKGNNNVYKNIFLKSAAVDMDKVFRDILIEEDMLFFQSRGYTIKNRNKKKIIPYTFYLELSNNKIDASNFDNREIYLFHGTNDDTALYHDILKYNLPNVHIVPVEGANHSFSDSEFKSIIDYIGKSL